jgi:succinoglycan biosynthesis protein ExoV
VVADAMHAAIVADALRVPWVPVVLSPQSNSFKWLDWTLSLNLPYKPVKLPASALLESLRYKSLRFYGPKFFFEDRTPSNAIKHYKRSMRLKYWRYWSAWRRRAMQITYSLPRRIFNSASFTGFRVRQDEKRTERAAMQLRRVAELPSFLSEESLFMSKLEQTADLLRKIKP